MKIISTIILVLLASTRLSAQIRGDSCVGKMNDINSNLSTFARRVEKIVQTSALAEVDRERSFKDHGKHESALKCFKKAVQLNADCYQTYGFHAILLQQDGRPNQTLLLRSKNINLCAITFKMSEPLVLDQIPLWRYFTICGSVN